MQFTWWEALEASWTKKGHRSWASGGVTAAAERDRTGTWARVPTSASRADWCHVVAARSAWTCFSLISSSAANTIRDKSIELL